MSLLDLIGGTKPEPTPEPTPEPAKEAKKRVYTTTKVKELRFMIEAFDHRLVGRTIVQFKSQLELDTDLILEIFADYPHIMRYNPTTNLWGLSPDAESDPARKRP